METYIENKQPLCMIPLLSELNLMVKYEMPS